MNRCSNKAFFVTLSHPLSSIFGKDEYVYPLNKETVLKSKNEWAQIRNADLNHKFVQHYEECKFIKSNNINTVELSFEPLASVRDDNDNIISVKNMFDEEIINMIVEDNSLFEIIENLLITNKDLYKSTYFPNHNYCLETFYASLTLNVPHFKDIPFKKLIKKKNIKNINLECIAWIINKYDATIDEIDKYIPLYAIPKQDDVEKLIKDARSLHGIYYYNYIDIDLLRMCDINMRLCDFIFKQIGRSSQYRIYYKEQFFQRLRKKNWKCFIGSGFTSFKFDDNPEYTLKENPCLIIFFPDEYHTKERYLNALKDDFECYNYLNKNFILQFSKKTKQ